MAKKKQKSKIKSPNKENIKEIRYLENLIRISLREANSSFQELNDFFKNQAARLNEKIKKIKENNG